MQKVEVEKINIPLKINANEKQKNNLNLTRTKGAPGQGSRREAASAASHCPACGGGAAGPARSSGACWAAGHSWEVKSCKSCKYYI